MTFITLDVYRAAIQCSPAHKPTLNQRKRKLAAQRMSQCSNLSWCTEDVDYNGQNHSMQRKVVWCKQRCLVDCCLESRRLWFRLKNTYIQAAFRITPFLRVSAAVITLRLFLSGDVELNPGPKEGK